MDSAPDKTVPDHSLALAQYRGEALDGARAWADLNPEERRRRAMLAAQHLDAAALWSLTEAHTLLYGGAGGALSPRTARAYREGVRKFLEHAARASVSVIRPERDSGPLYARTLEAAGLAPSSVRVNLAAARALYRALRWAGVTQLDPFSDTKAAKDKTAAWDKRQPYTEEEVRRLLDASSSRDRALILLCAHGGLRIAEALALTWDDWQGDSLTVRHGKGGKLRRVTCSPSLTRALEVLERERQGQYVDQTPPEAKTEEGQTRSAGQAASSSTSPAALPREVIGGTQTAARERLRALCKRASVTYRGWHALRHYAGTRLVRQTGSLEHAARHLGHSSIETTRVYAKWSDRALSDALAGW